MHKYISKYYDYSELYKDITRDGFQCEKSLLKYGHDSMESFFDRLRLILKDAPEYYFYSLAKMIVHNSAMKLGKIEMHSTVSKSRSEFSMNLSIQQFAHLFYAFDKDFRKYIDTLKTEIDRDADLIKVGKSFKGKSMTTVRRIMYLDILKIAKEKEGKKQNIKDAVRKYIIRNKLADEPLEIELHTKRIYSAFKKQEAKLKKNIV